MLQYNNSNIFTLIDFSFYPSYKIAITTMLFLTYNFTIIENTVLITMIKVDRCLHTPMYFFLGNFSFLECCYTTIVLPKTLYIAISDDRTIFFSSCIIQLYIFISLGATECLLLATMAYDRFVAICFPLHYMIMISRNVCLLLVFCSWVIGFLSPLLPAIFISQIHFCSYKLNHFFCDVPPILRVACSNTSHIELTVSFISAIILMSSFVIIVVSYSRIVCTILIMQSKKGFQKAVSTCASHLAVVFIYYGSGMYMYVRPNSYKTLETNKLVSLLYAVLTPMLNPLIYSFRNDEVNKAFRRLLKLSINVLENG